MGGGREYPAHPLVGLGAMIHREGRILLIKRKFEPNKGRWSLPGGLLETGEKLQEGVKREVREELGIDIEIEELFHVAEEIISDAEGKSKYHFVLVDFLARPLQEKITLNDESEEFRWFEPDEIACLDASANTKLIVKKYELRKESNA